MKIEFYKVGGNRYKHGALRIMTENEKEAFDLGVGIAKFGKEFEITYIQEPCQIIIPLQEPFNE